MFEVEAGMVLLVGWNSLTDHIAAKTNLHWTLDFLAQLLPESFRSPQRRVNTSPVPLTRYLARERQT